MNLFISATLWLSSYTGRSLSSSTWRYVTTSHSSSLNWTVKAEALNYHSASIGYLAGFTSVPERGYLPDCSHGQGLRIHCGRTRPYTLERADLSIRALCRHVESTEGHCDELYGGVYRRKSQLVIQYK